MALLPFILSGLIMGLLVRALMSWKNMRLVPTMLFALTGAFLGGLAGCVKYGGHVFDLHGLNAVGLILVVVFVLLFIGIRTSRHRSPNF